MLAKADAPGNSGASAAADQRVEPLAEPPLVALLKLVEPFADHHAQHPVAQELKPLVIAGRPGAAVGQRLKPEGLVDRGPPRQRGEEFMGGGFQHGALRTRRRYGSTGRR